MTHDPAVLPPGLPVPEDDGAAAHLPGLPVPSVALPATGGGTVDLAERSRGRRVVLFAYPRTGRPGQDPLPGWDDIPGARGCTPEACSFRDLAPEFAERGAEVYGLSTQSAADQQEAATRLRLPYALLSDAGSAFAIPLRLPTFTAGGLRLLRRLTLLVHDGTIQRVLYPVFPPDRAAADALRALDS
ncbi:peroxiredoxin [Blastococcus sp. CT_GayMR19]|uniref:peroxiredoxin n=1 Tax=Blastococcus sp. CT_GayMR19 TaxID=2559608 RepID=UPI001073FF2D|nr:peroxiredoxin [Blastococcus sp. CT_GayMR19]TFV78416.1 peroxiredoxin [Blastococcus sp. CT_GayMR19]